MKLLNNTGQMVNSALVGVAILSAIGTKTLDWATDKILNSPEKIETKISTVDLNVTRLESRVDKVCTYATNQADRIDKNLQAIAKALKVDVVSGNDKDNPCQR